MQHLHRTLGGDLRANLTRALLARYFGCADSREGPPNFYTLSGGAAALCDVEARLTDDVRDWSVAMSELWTEVAKPSFDAVFYAWRLAPLLGACAALCSMPRSRRRLALV